MAKNQNRGNPSPNRANKKRRRGGAPHLVSIRVRLLAMMVVVVLLVAAAMGAGSAVVGLSSARQQAFRQLESVTTLKVKQIDAWIEDLQLDLEALLTESYEMTRLRTVILWIELSNPEEAQTTLRLGLQGQIDRAQRFEEVFLLNMDGEVVLSTNPEREGENEGARTFFERGLEEQYVQPPSYDWLADDLSVFFARPALDTYGDLVGVVVARASMGRLEEIMEERAGLGQTGETYLVSALGHPLTKLGSPLDGETVESSLAQAAKSERTQGRDTYKGYHNAPVLGAYQWVPALEGTLLAEQKASEVTWGARVTIMINAGVALGSVAAAVLVSVLVSQSITDPLTELSGTASQIAAGNLDLEAEPGRRDEIGVLAGALNHMAGRLREMLHSEQQQRAYLEAKVQEYVAYMVEVKQGNLGARLAFDEGGRDADADDPLLALGRILNETTSSLQDVIARIWETANNLDSAATQILSATTQQAAGATEQASAISQITTTVDQVKAIAEQSVSRSQQVVDVAQRTVMVSQTGQQAVQDTIDSMGRIKARVEDIAENILALSEQTQQIGEIIDAVNDIASQSNMLALNAAVEAARAGEHGRGFSIVAEEVRDLAERSREATAQIRAILSDIQGATNATVMATEEGTKDVDQGAHLAAQAQEAIAQLAQVIDESAQMATQLSAGGQQQASGVEQIAVSMQNINQATMQSLSGTKQAERSAQQLNELARSLTAVVEQYQM